VKTRQGRGGGFATVVERGGDSMKIGRLPLLHAEMGRGGLEKKNKIPKRVRDQGQGKE